MELVYLTIVFLVLLLLVVWWPFVNKKSIQTAYGQEDSREQTNVRLYHEHKSEIEKDYAEGGIDQENYQYLLAELDKSLLQDIDVGENDTKPFADINNNNLNVFWPISLSVFVLIFSLALYDKQGSFQQILIAKPNQPHQGMSQKQQEDIQHQQTMAQVKQLQQRTQDNPDDGEAWYNLGQTLVGAGMFDNAIAAFDQVIRIEGEHADLFGAQAQAMYYRNNQTIDAQVQALIDKALALDVNDPSTNILLGMHNFINKNYQQAIEHWQRMIDAKKQNVNVAALQEAVEEAKRRLGLTNTTAENSMPVVSGPKLIVNVSLSSEIADQLAQGEDKVVFRNNSINVYLLNTT